MSCLYFLGDSNYKTAAKGSMCSELSDEINSETECKNAATKLGLKWGLAWNGPNDFPACLYAQDGRNLVYFNSSPNPGRENVNSTYAAICKSNKGIQLNLTVLFSVQQIIDPL